MEQYKSILMTGLEENAAGLFNRIPFKIAVSGAIAPTNGFPIYGKYSVAPAGVADGQSVMIRTDDIGNLMVSLTSGATPFVFAVDDDPFPAMGMGNMVEYQAVPDSVDDGDAVPMQADAYGHQENAAYNRSLGSEQVVEQAPVAYDILRGIARADAVLPGAGAFDAAPTEISTGGRQFVELWYAYTRGAAGGSFRDRVEKAVREGGVDMWGQDAVISTAVFAAGADSNSRFQREDFSYQATGAAEEIVIMQFDLGRADKFRVPARELGIVGTPGDLEIKYILYNE